MALYLTNDDVQRLLPMADCVSVLDDLFRQEAAGLVETIARRRIRFGRGAGGGTLMGGAVLGSHAYGIRNASHTLLYDTESGKLDAVLEPGTLAWIRTGAATGVAVRYMSAPEAAVAGVFGTGRQAATQIDGICAVRPLRLIKVFSRSEERRSAFAAEMTTRSGVEVRSVATPEECIAGSQIVVAITNAREPVFDGALLEPGTHVTAAGSNSWMKREIDEVTIERASVIAVDNLEQAKVECGELIWAAERGFRWNRAVPLHEVVSGRVAGYPSVDGITLFESQGIGTEDIAASAYVVRKARELGVGVELPF